MRLAVGDAASTKNISYPENIIVPSLPKLRPVNYDNFVTMDAWSFDAGLVSQTHAARGSFL